MNTKIWAHRGSSGKLPENTLEAFKQAIEDGAEGIELDVQLSKDKTLVIIHDETIDRTSDYKGFVKDYTIEELKSFNFSDGYKNKNYKIPTLEEVLKLIKNTDIILNIELKTGRNFYENIEKKTLELVSKMKMNEKVIYSSFNHESIKKIQELDEKAKTAFLYSDGYMDIVEYALKYNIDALHPDFYNLQYKNFIQNCKNNNIDINVWNVNDEYSMNKCIKLGVNSIITNYPKLAIKLRERLINHV